MKAQNLWSIVLAGGEGERTRLFIERWLGVHKPKQYCRFVGTRSLFQHTVDRADLLAPAERRVTVVARHHRQEAQAQLSGRAAGRLVLQPENHGTAAGVYLPLSYVCALDPQANVAVYPSDHFIYPERRLIEAVADAAGAVERIPQKAVLLGVNPQGAEHDYGWIIPGQEYRHLSSVPVRTVKRFVEKPDSHAARKAMEAGGLWNTFIIVAKAALLWKLGWYLLPDLMEHFEWIRKAVGTPRELEVIEEAYKTVPVWNFSTHILQRAPRNLAVAELNGVYWSDWGRPERIAETLRIIGKQPLFPPEAVLAN